MTSVKFVDDLPPQRHVGGRPPKITPQLLDQLRANPGKWAVVCEDVSVATIRTWTRRYPEFEFAGRRDPVRNSPVRTTAYGRAVAK